MTRFVPLAEPLSDGIVSLRLPSPDAGDIETAEMYAHEEGQRAESWLPLIPGTPAARSVGDWLEGWAGRPSHNGPTLLVTIAEDAPFIGIVGLGDRGEACVEMICGIAPRWRGRGLATRSVRLAASWLLGLPDVSTVELCVAHDNIASQHVAANAGFVLIGTVSQFVPGTGETFEDLHYVRR